MTVNPKLQEALSRVSNKDELILKLLEGQVDEGIAKAAGLRSKSEDPPTPENPTEQPATLTDAEADAIVDRLWTRFEARFDAKTAEQTTAQEAAATKAQEPVAKALETVQKDVAAIKATFAQLLGEQPAAHQHYRASTDPATVKAGDQQQHHVQPPSTVQSMTDHILATRQQQQGG